MLSKSHGEMKCEIVERVGGDTSRYAQDLGGERHRTLTRAEIERICEALGLEMLTDESKQQMKDSLMIKLGRDHRTGVGYFDSSDLSAILEALQEVTSDA